MAFFSWNLAEVQAHPGRVSELEKAEVSAVLRAIMDGCMGLGGADTICQLQSPSFVKTTNSVSARLARA